MFIVQDTRTLWSSRSRPATVGQRIHTYSGTFEPLALPRRAAAIGACSAVRLSCRQGACALMLCRRNVWHIDPIEHIDKRS